MRGPAALVMAAICIWCTPAAAFNYYVSSQGHLLHWEPGDCTFTYFIDSKGMADIAGDSEIDIINSQVDKWNALECTAMKWTYGGLQENAVSEIDQTNIVLFVEEDWGSYAPDDVADIDSWVAFTLLTFDPGTGVIFDADLLVNLDLFNYAHCSGAPDETGKVDLEYTILHEWGHMFGLGHSDDPDAIMQEKARRCEDEAEATLGQDDIDGVCWYYSDEEWNELCLNPPLAEPVPDMVTSDLGAADLELSDSGPVDSNPDSDTCDSNCSCFMGSSGSQSAWPSGALLLACVLLFLLLSRTTRERNTGLARREENNC